MSRIPDAPAAVYSPSHRPTWFDFLLILVGTSISLALADWSTLKAQGTSATPSWVNDALSRFLPQLLLMPVGLLLFWPFFFLTQRVRGRVEPLSSGEWLWGVAWIAVLPWCGWVVWQHWATFPDMLQPDTVKRWIFIGYAIGVLALGSIALFISLVGVAFRWRQPWTHNFALVLLIWPALWLSLCLAWGIELQ